MLVKVSELGMYVVYLHPFEGFGTHVQVIMHELRLIMFECVKYK